GSMCRSIPDLVKNAAVMPRDSVLRIGEPYEFEGGRGVFEQFEDSELLRGGSVARNCDSDAIGIAACSSLRLGPYTAASAQSADGDLSERYADGGERVCGVPRCRHNSRGGRLLE